MKCPKCQFENRELAKFCLKCGEGLELNCPQCSKTLPLFAEFCDECGHRLEEVAEKEEKVLGTEGERKHVTVLFSDISGYTAISEKLDPEDVKELTSQIFDEVSQVVGKYEGFVEKFVGDAVMALFGVPDAHEDDPIRAIKAAREIHEIVDVLSPDVEKKIGQTLSMHTGINTGLVVTGHVDRERGTHGVAGDTINVAARLSSLAKPGEILVSKVTSRRAEGHFDFKNLEPTEIKGKEEPIQACQLLSVKETPVTMHRLSGIRADLIGRSSEIAQLGEAVEKLKSGKGTIFSICGDAGTGKSRLVEEFKATLHMDEIQWFEGHTYAYTQNIPYFLLIDLLNKIFKVDEGDSPEKVRERIESVVESLVDEKEDVIPYIGSLYSLSYPEIDDVSPEFWKSRLRKSIQKIISALALRAPTVFFLEDLQWADPSFVELLRDALLQIRQPAIVLCAYRPTFNLFTSHQLNSLGRIYEEIRLQDLSPSEAQYMLQSLLNTETIPSDLDRLIQTKAEGNPFYLEELINSLIESETLIRDNGAWKLTSAISESEISSTIHGVISGRLDRLETETKKILQEASVIGRAFLYDILRRVTMLQQDLDRCLRGLEQLDLIRTRSIQPDLEYMFKHALTQEVVYNGLLKKERQVIHERIAEVVELVFRDRLPEFYETLAFHYTRSRSVHKAVEYLIKSGEKSLRRYSVDEAHIYFEEAFEVLTNKSDKTKEEKELLIDLLCKWAWVFLFRGHWRGMFELFSAHENLAQSLDNKVARGMLYSWFGVSLWGLGQLKDAYQYARQALSLSEETDDPVLLCYSCVWLAWACAEMGKFDEGLALAQRGNDLAKSIGSDHFLNFKSLGGMGMIYFYTGELEKAFEIGKIILDYGRIYSQSRSLVLGHSCMGWGHFWAGDFSSAIECFQRAQDAAADPMYTLWGKLFLAVTKVLNGELHQADDLLQECIDFCNDCRGILVEQVAYIFYGVVLVSKGKMNQGLKMIENASQSCLKNERKPVYALAEYILGKVYSQMKEGAGSVSVSTIVKNIHFIIKNLPLASKKSEEHFTKAITSAREIGAKGIMGVAYLDLGSLHKTKKRTKQAHECISEAIKLFEEIGSDGYLKQAREALASLG
jgi:class 3 adenylate cyclase/tetratricopeptide (TPR) repeat protein